MGVTNRIGFFLHIPWPAHQLVVTLPRHRPLVEAMFHYDLIGFQTEESLHPSRAMCSPRCTGQERSSANWRRSARRTQAAAFPIGVDAKDFAEITQARRPSKVYDRMMAHSVFRKMIVGVDRLDYSKGLEERLLGFERFLHDNPEPAREVMLLQIAPMSRDEVEAYQDLRARLDGLIGRINGAYAEMDWHADPLREPLVSPRRAGRRLSRRQGGPGHAAARRHEPGGQGICRGPEPGRSRRADPVALRRRGAADEGRPDHQSQQPRGDLRRV
jgi:trehalose-6-phosphate synthase